ncbi:MAG TPA: hypothetical protein VNU96_15150 [Burkholderiales bacterium]|jgi:hypothetical protein|nr:hypothetical protein [Burkholderiales bacterium]
MQGAGAAPRDEIAVAGKRSPGKDRPLRGYWLAIAGIAVVVAVAVVTASLRMTEGAIDRAVADREAADRFLARELAVLRIMAMSSDSPVPARLYLGIEECFDKSVAIPFEGDEAGRRTLAACAQMELGRLHAQGGPAMAEKGRALLSQIGLLN